MKTSEIKIFSKNIIYINLIILIIVSLVILILGKYSILFGYILGALTSYITFLMHAYAAENKTNTKEIIGSVVIRTLISAISLLISLFVSFIDMIATFIGLLVIKLTILIYSFVTNLKYGKGGNIEENESN